jgi:hypothetical protein
MNLESKPMGSTELILCLSANIGIEPGLLVETIGDDPDLMSAVKSYRLGDLTFDQVLDTLGEYF